MAPVTTRTTSRYGVPAGTAGLLLLHSASEPVVDWARRGVVPVQVVPLEGWTAVVPSGPSRAAAPYDEPVPMLAGRPVPHRLCPALGFFVTKDKAVLTVRTSGWRRVPRWVVWEPATAVLTAPGLALASPSDLVRAADTSRPAARREVRDLLRSRNQLPTKLLAQLIEALDLPGADLFGDAPAAALQEGSVAVDPQEDQVALFDDAVKDVVLLRSELEVDR